MTADRNRPSPAPGRRVLAFGLALIGAAAAVGAPLPARTGLEEVVVLEIPFTISPVAVALYSGVTVGTFLVTLLFVVQAISRFDETRCRARQRAIQFRVRPYPVACRSRPVRRIVANWIDAACGRRRFAHAPVVSPDLPW